MRLTKFRLAGVFLLLVIGLVATPHAQADTIITFSITGTFANGAVFNAGSAVTINVTTGILTGSTLNISAGSGSPANTFTFADMVSSGGFGTPFEWTLADGTTVFFFMPVPPDFIGFAGGTIGLVTYTGPFGFSGGSTNTVLTPVAAPEPGAIPLLGIGLLGLMGMALRRNSHA
jgi:hypothetical protein